MGRKIEDLSEKEKFALVNDYFENKEISVTEIIKKYDLDYKKNELVRFLPYKETTEICPYCNVSMNAKIKGRGILDYPSCWICGHIKYNESYMKCECNNCRQLLVEEQKKKRCLIEAAYSQNEKINFSDLDLKTQIKLSRMILKSSSDFIIFDPNKIDVINDWEVIDKLIEKKYFTVSSKNDITAFEDCDKFPYYYNKYRVLYDINIVFSEEEKELLCKNRYFCQKSDRLEKLKVLKDYIHKDVMNYFKKELLRRGLYFEIMPAAEEEFKKLYEILSYGQIINQCYGMARHISDQVISGRISSYDVPKMALHYTYCSILKGLNKGWHINNSDVFFAERELQDFITNILRKDMTILNSVVTEDML